MYVYCLDLSHTLQKKQNSKISLPFKTVELAFFTMILYMLENSFAIMYSTLNKWKVLQFIKKNITWIADSCVIVRSCKSKSRANSSRISQQNAQNVLAKNDASFLPETTLLSVNKNKIGLKNALYWGSRPPKINKRRILYASFLRFFAGMIRPY